MFVQRIAGLLAGTRLKRRVVKALALTPRGGWRRMFCNCRISLLASALNGLLGRASLGQRPPFCVAR
jgi:hypothetical protein